MHIYYMYVYSHICNVLRGSGGGGSAFIIMCLEVLHNQAVLYYDENTPVGIRLAIHVTRARHKTSFEG